MALYSSLSRKVYGAVLVVMFLISVLSLESARCEESTASLTGGTSVTTEAAFPDVKNSQVHALESGDMKTVARRGSTGRRSSSARPSVGLPSVWESAVAFVIVNVAAAAVL